MPRVPANQKADTGGSLDPRRLILAWAAKQKCVTKKKSKFEPTYREKAT